MSEVSPREFEALQRRVEQMDEKGTRGVAGVAIQLGEAIKDIGDLRDDLKSHEQVHEKDREHREAAEKKDREQRDRQRIATLRFRVTTWIAGLATSAAVIGILVDIASKVHG